MASENIKASERQRKPKKGRMFLVTNPKTTWDIFTDGRGYLAVTDPYEPPLLPRQAV